MTASWNELSVSESYDDRPCRVPDGDQRPLLGATLMMTIKPIDAAEAMELDDVLYDMEGMADFLRDRYYHEHEVAAADMDKACDIPSQRLLQRLKQS